MKKQLADSSYIKSLKALRGEIFADTPLKDSVYEQAISYFAQRNQDLEQKQKLLSQQDALTQQCTEKHSAKKLRELQEQLKNTERKLKALNSATEEQRHERQHHLLKICHKVLDIVEGEDFEETLRNSAKALGSLLLMSPQQGKFRIKENEKSKHLYKAILCLRLLDRLVLDGKMANFYVQHYSGSVVGGKDESFKTQAFKEHVQIPLIMAALLQDIGHYHPEAQLLLHGEDGKQNPYRALDADNRKKLLKINYRETLRYVTSGIGTAKYIGNSKQEREEFNKQEQQKLKFIRMLLKSWINPENGTGNLLKIPQVYTSIILSTKTNFDYQLLPNVYDVLLESATKGTYNKVAVDALLKITGKFPQGFGIIYIPRDSDGDDLERYEYAIVNRLYPEEANVPTCRQTSKNLQFSTSGLNQLVGTKNNLYFAATRKQLAQIGEHRLKEIMSLLSSNYQQQQDLELLPKCWHPNDFFLNGKNQNLWNESIQIRLT